MSFQVKVVKLFTDTEKLKAIANIIIDDGFAVHDIKIIDSDKSLFVAMPSVKISEKRKDIFHPINAEARKQLVNALFAAYNECKANDQTVDGE